MKKMERTEDGWNGGAPLEPGGRGAVVRGMIRRRVAGSPGPGRISPSYSSVSVQKASVCRLCFACRFHPYNLESRS